MRSRLKKKDVGRVAFSIAGFISLVLLITAYGKLFYPAASLKGVDRMVGLFELILLGFLVVFRRSGEMWLIASIIFGAWGGYAWFWYHLELPCGCMGELLHIPSVFSLALDLLFIALSLMMAYFFRVKKSSLWGAVICSVIAGGVGFFCADAIYCCWVIVQPS